jgi:alkanesulfonate monooxygenase SsuD/methylene tetrahydromethanopterin reductase-like flavin-dependent oxidoreductase (luciferase family)
MPDKKGIVTFGRSGRPDLRSNPPFTSTDTSHLPSRASKSGIDFAGKHAEAIYTDNSTIASLAEYVREVRAAYVKHGRHPNSVKVFMAIVPILGKTQEEAQAKHDKAKLLASIKAGLAKFS